MKFTDLDVRHFILPVLEEHAYVVSGVGSDECIFVDPGMNPKKAIDSIRAAKLTPRAIFITHGHWDHIGGVSEVRQIWPNLPIYIGENDRDKLTDPIANLSASFGFPQTTFEADHLLKDGETFDVAGISWRVLEIPGHTVGHVVYLAETEKKRVVFSGDVVFAGNVGRSDLPGGDGRALLRGIREKILTLPGDTILFPGHGPETTVDVEKRFNPFLR